jgi:hypothetical protein
MLAAAVLLSIWLFSATFLKGSARVISPAWFAVGLVLAVAIAAVWRKWLSDWRIVVGGYAVVGLVLVWLSWDDAKIERPLTLAELSTPAAGDAAASHAATLWFTAHDGKPALHQFQAPKLTLKKSLPDPKGPAAWRAEIESHRDGIRAAWASAATEREWFATMNRFAVIADLGEARLDSPTIQRQPFLAISQLACAQAGLLAMEGQGDQAMDLLLPFVEVSHKLEPAARSLARAKLARLGQAETMATARFILSQAPVSPELRARLAAAIAIRDPAAGIQRIMLIETARAHEALYSSRVQTLGSWQGGQPTGWDRLFSEFLDLLDPLILLRRATANEWGAFARDIPELAARRDLDQLQDREYAFLRQILNGRLKNPGGALQSLIMVSSLNPGWVVARFWETEDSRVALQAALKG